MPNTSVPAVDFTPFTSSIQRMDGSTIRFESSVVRFDGATSRFDAAVTRFEGMIKEPPTKWDAGKF